ncbi:MAG: homocysteine S-methyltransferase family protein [Pseudomonadota bacterium]
MNAHCDWLTQRLLGNGPPVLIDGGMATELNKAGVPMDEKVWSASAVLTHPAVIQQCHERYIQAGAEVIIANTICAGRHVLEPARLGDCVRKINQDAVKLAIQARDKAADRRVAIAGSVCEWAGPEDPYWHSTSGLRSAAHEQIAILVDAGVDIIALEMCQIVDKSIVLIDEALASGLPVWIGVSARSFDNVTHLSVFDHAQTDFEILISEIRGYEAAPFNVMHTPVTDVDAALEIVQRHWPGPIGVYPESGRFGIPHWNFDDVIDPQKLSEYARGWLEKGVRLLGGCCGFGPQHIQALDVARQSL